MSGARSNGKQSPPRDQATSTFTHILERLVASTSGAVAAALVDFEGETVDYAGHVDVFELKVAAAHWRIAMSEIADTPQIGSIRRITVRARARAYLIRQLEENYAIVLILHRWAAFTVSDRALSEAVTRLSAEAGWPTPLDAGRWRGVEVETARRDRTRPVRLRVAEGWQPVEVMGALVGLAPREKGFRVRLPSGAEMTLIRERLGRWFADEHVE